MKKGEMAEAAEQLLAGSGWLPEPLRTPGRALVTVTSEPTKVIAEEDEITGETAEAGGEPTTSEDKLDRENGWNDEDEAYPLAAE